MFVTPQTKFGVVYRKYSVRASSVCLSVQMTLMRSSFFVDNWPLMKLYTIAVYTLPKDVNTERKSMSEKYQGR